MSQVDRHAVLACGFHEPGFGAVVVALTCTHCVLTIAIGAVKHYAGDVFRRQTHTYYAHLLNQPKSLSGWFVDDCRE